jgi:hypothetical protein
MGKKKVRKEAGEAVEPDFIRVMFQAPPEMVERLDRIARSLGLSRSAYIRLACHERMLTDDPDGG